MSDFTSPWYVLRVKSRQEQVVARSVAGKGMEAFLPLYRTTRHWSDRIRQLDLPLFPGYVFCRLNGDRRLPVLQIPAVLNFVSDSVGPIPVDELEMAAIHRLMSVGVPMAPWPFLSAGQKVRMTRGYLKGVEGVLINIKNHCRVVVSITLLQRSVSIEVDRDLISPM